VHIAALGGVWMIAVLGFAGLSYDADGVTLNPQLPEGWAKLTFPMQWRGRALNITVSRADPIVEATLLAGEPVHVTVGGRSHMLGASAPLIVHGVN